MKSLVKFSATFLITLSLVTGICFSVGAAVGKDDGTATMTEKNGIVYFGTQKGEWCTSFVASNKTEKSFLRYDNVDLSGDGFSNICDLVSVAETKPTDINFDGKTNADDIDIVRYFLLGQKDFEI